MYIHLPTADAARREKNFHQLLYVDMRSSEVIKEVWRKSSSDITAVVLSLEQPTAKRKENSPVRKR